MLADGGLCYVAVIYANHRIKAAPSDIMSGLIMFCHNMCAETGSPPKLFICVVSERASLAGAVIYRTGVHVTIKDGECDFFLRRKGSEVRSLRRR